MPLQFRFDPNQPYQLQAIQAAVDLFEGQPYTAPEVAVGETGGFAVVPNRLDIDEQALRANLLDVQTRNLPERLRDADLQTIEGVCQTDTDTALRVAFCNFSVEMETATGKTYVYLRTALELAQRYGLRKFIIVVPSIAVCEGVLKTFELTRSHFADLTNNLPYRFCKYDSANLSQVRQFALSDSVEFMVMTLASFNRASNILLQSRDQLQGETPVRLLQACNPILILDEPQNMESERSQAALCNLNPLLALRYSATHRNPYNLIYRLTPADAYQQGLVKKIEVSSVVQTGGGVRPFLRCEAVTSSRNTIRARLHLHRQNAAGEVQEAAVTIGAGDDLQQLTNRPEYAGYGVEEINYGEATVTFTNGVTIRQGEDLGTDKAVIFKAQISETLRRHFEKQARLRPLGIKVLSLFFIDRVASYAAEEGLIRRVFDECFREIAPRHDDWRDLDPATVQAAYFAQQKRRDGRLELLDSSTGEAQKDDEAYLLIMKRKEQLLSFDEPVSFIFSHSALREGWDNPNIFQICTLNETVSEMRKRQEIGRGMRLAVDQTGARLFDPQVNVLTVVANEHYEDYVRGLQSELAEAGFSAAEQGPPPQRTDDKVTARLRAEQLLSPEFRELWERIKRRTRYAVDVDTEALIESVCRDLEALEVEEPRVMVRRVAVEITEQGAEAGVFRGQAAGQRITTDRVPDLLAMLRHQLEHSKPECTLTRRTLLTMLQAPGVLAKAVRNPQAFALEAARVIRRRLVEQIVQGIRYFETGEYYEQARIFSESFEYYASEAEESKRGLYTHIQCDSGVERRFTAGLDNREDVKFFTKLPAKFKVDTPVGTYNPDWALVAELEQQDGRKQRLYLVRETKGTTEVAQLRPEEQQRIACGAKHFHTVGVGYAVTDDPNQMP